VSQHTLDKKRSTTQNDAERGGKAAAKPTDVPGLLAQMTLTERIRAYRTGSISRRELTIAAAREPDRMPIRNGEFEWIALSLADLE
jgi:hypothetical protein